MLKSIVASGLGNPSGFAIGGKNAYYFLIRAILSFSNIEQNKKPGEAWTLSPGWREKPRPSGE